ncbi:CAP domain-containing protein [Thiovibrio frasassiensis]|uniref:CAP domain-containing protein n=1 Tax=Thiovibrio frasassiensis TaxID=2984131 RepID=A0A9X4MNG3_9BACT|nr:CAP domain-containing protein [Thiovibrio frasassiensis]MDG4475892.1 CAP domain-containing protein [Thiovibrio frasassiensis]
MQQQPTIRFRRDLLLAGSLLLLSLLSAQPSPAQDKPVDAMCMLEEHNILRAAVGTPELRWSDALAGQAAAWAKELQKTGCGMKHSQSGLGENIYWASAWKSGTRSPGKSSWQWRLSPQPITEKNVVASWGVEQSWYSQASNTCAAPSGKSCGHYTQMVWRTTREVGCAKAICEDSSQVWVCNYAPAGNIIGRRPY